MLKVCLREQILRHLESLNVQLAAVDVGLDRQRIEKTALAAGEVRNQVVVGWRKTLRDELAELRRGEELTVFDLLLRLTVFMVVVILAAAQSVQAAVAGIGVEDVRRSNAAMFTGIAVD